MLVRSRPTTCWAYLVANGRFGGGVGDDHAALEDARADPDEGEAVAVGDVHAGLHLEHEGAERRVDRAWRTDRVGAGAGRGGEVDEGVQQVADAEVEHGRAEQHRGALRGQEAVDVVAGSGLGEQLALLLGLHEGVALQGDRRVGVQVLLGGDGGTAVGAGEAQVAAGGDVQDAAEVAGDADRPVQRGRLQTGALADLVHQVEGVVARPVPLVDHGDDRDAPVPADLEQLHRLRLEALGGVDEHHGGVDRRQHPVGVLGEVGVAGGVDQVDHGAAVAELQGGRGDRDAALALDVHPVGHGAAAAVLAVHGAGAGHHPGVQGQGLGERRLAGVGVADHGERPAAGGLRGRLGGRGPRHARRAHRVGPSCNLTGATSLRSTSGPPAGGHSDGTSAARVVRNRRNRPPGGERSGGVRRSARPAWPAGAQGCSASNSASATTSSSASRRMWPRTAWSRRMIRAALSPQVDR